jgi:hypothetical protein
MFHTGQRKTAAAVSTHEGITARAQNEARIAHYRHLVGDLAGARENIVGVR